MTALSPLVRGIQGSFSLETAVPIPEKLSLCSGCGPPLVGMWAGVDPIREFSGDGTFALFPLEGDPLPLTRFHPASSRLFTTKKEEKNPQIICPGISSFRYQSQYRQCSPRFVTSNLLLIGSLVLEMHPGFGHLTTPRSTCGISTPIFSQTR